ncbi:hypothetical protein GCM10022225_18600 [Plantactinospora mayteni]|uniref:Uncharacterized protein n=1 Tax=Plantactinospora mayteni TaxID=566021 RepID=A0ABQ4EN20_9ACTN|nr:hypothetical protein Pma05_26180 [Plantactinospora mayteni]
MTASRRTGLGLALAAAVAVGAALAGTGPVQAAPPPCGEYAAFYVANPDGGPILPGDGGSDSRNPRDVFLSVSSPARYVALSGVHQTRRSIIFSFYNQDNALIRQYVTAPADDGGLIRPERNVIPWDYGVGTRIRVDAVIRVRCDGDDRPKTVYVGVINTVP